MSNIDKFTLYSDVLRKLIFRAPNRAMHWGMKLAGEWQKLEKLTPGHFNALDSLKKDLMVIVQICFGRDSPHERVITSIPREWAPAVEMLKACLSKMMKEIGDDEDQLFRREQKIIPEIQDLPPSTRKELDNLADEAWKLLQANKINDANEKIFQMVTLLPDLPHNIVTTTNPSPHSSSSSSLEFSHNSPDDETTLRWKREADEFFARGKNNQARESYMRYLKFVPNDAEIWCRLGEMSVQAGKQQRAEREFHECLQHDPNNAHAKDRLEQLQRLKDRKSAS